MTGVPCVRRHPRRFVYRCSACGIWQDFDKPQAWVVHDCAGWLLDPIPPEPTFKMPLDLVARPLPVSQGEQQ